MTNCTKSPKSIGFPSLVADIHRMYTTTLYRQLRADGIQLTSAQWRVIVHLNHRNGPTQSELAELLLIEKAPLGSLLDKLETNGLIERRADPEDRRAKRIYLLPKALPLIPPLEKTAIELRESAAEGLNEDELTELNRLLSKLHENLRHIRISTSETKGKDLLLRPES